MENDEKALKRQVLANTVVLAVAEKYGVGAGSLQRKNGHKEARTVAVYMLRITYGLTFREIREAVRLNSDSSIYSAVEKVYKLLKNGKLERTVIDDIISNVAKKSGTKFVTYPVTVTASLVGHPEDDAWKSSGENSKLLSEKLEALQESGKVSFQVGENNPQKKIERVRKAVFEKLCGPSLLSLYSPSDVDTVVSHARRAFNYLVWKHFRASIQIEDILSELNTDRADYYAAVGYFRELVDDNTDGVNAVIRDIEKVFEVPPQK